MQIRILSVSEATRYIKRVLTSDPILYSIRVKGEISNFKFHSSGHMYFSLKDDQSKMNCVMFRTNCEGLKFYPEEGMDVVVKGHISVYERDGQYQLYASEMEPAGIGALFLAFQQLKNRLEKEGLFDKEKKKPLPYLPQKIGVITSPAGAAIRDIVSVIRRRFQNVEVYVFPVLVQGENASESIVKAIETANCFNDIDVIILGRGGGSIEELWAFNEEAVARAIYKSTIPIVSAVGHETDYSIADFVADLRAPTPSAAAELVVPDLNNLKRNIQNIKNRLSFAMDTKLSEGRSRLNYIENSYAFKYPMNYVYNQKQNIDGLLEDLVKSIDNIVVGNRKEIKSIGERLNALSPLSVFTRGYSIVKDQDNVIVKSVEQVKEDDLINIDLMDGEIECKVINVLKEEKTFVKNQI